MAGKPASLQGSDASNPDGNKLTDIEDIHLAACRQGLSSYQDPKTGFTVFTEVAHLKRGKCCGNQCRHCPYGWVNVRKSDDRRPAKAISGDRESTSKVLQELVRLDDSTSATNEIASKQVVGSGKGGRHGGKLTTKNVPYTRGGDKGKSSILTGERRMKDDIVFEAMGTVDELCAFVGVAHAELLSRSEIDYGQLSDWLLDVMSRLFDAGSHIAKPRPANDEDDDSDVEEHEFKADGVGGGFDPSYVDEMEAWIDTMTEDLPELGSFVIPSGGKLGAHLHVCRTVCRRAERRVIPLAVADQPVCDPNVLMYLNRLSDFFFTASRYANMMEEANEVQYRRPYRGATQRNISEVALRSKNTKP